jgi:hypothetical protein
VLVGPAGSGKSHLAAILRARADAIALAPAELSPDPSAALGARRAALVEDVDRGAAGRPLLHLHNLLAERGGTLLLTAREPPARWDVALADLRSRLAALPLGRARRARRRAARRAAGQAVRRPPAAPRARPRRLSRAAAGAQLFRARPRGRSARRGGARRAARDHGALARAALAQAGLIA